MKSPACTPLMRAMPFLRLTILPARGADRSNPPRTVAECQDIGQPLYTVYDLHLQFSAPPYRFDSVTAACRLREEWQHYPDQQEANDQQSGQPDVTRANK